MFKRESKLHRFLKKNPNQMYVEDTFMAVLMPDQTVLVISGDFKNATAEYCNTKLQEVLRQMQ